MAAQFLDETLLPASVDVEDRVARTNADSAVAGGSAIASLRDYLNLYI
jgi:hypothetical protein